MSLQQENLNKNYKVFPQVLVVLIANGGSFLYGSSLGWSSPSGPQILNSNESFVTTTEFSWVVALMPLGAAMSCVFAGILRNRLGTKRTILIFGFPNLVGWILIIFGLNLRTLMLGRFLTGVAGGCYCYVILIYVGEIASKEIRGILLTFFQVFIKLGIVFMYILGSLVDNYFLQNIICGSMSVLYTAFFMLLPESPVYLLKMKKVLEAEQSMEILRGAKYDTKEELSEISRHLEESSKLPESSLYSVIKKRENLKPFLIILCLFIFFQMSGINAVTVYATTIFIESGIEVVDPPKATIIIGLAQVLVTMSTILFVDRFGRKSLLIVSFVSMCFGLVGFGIFFLLKSEGFQFIQWLPLPALSIFVVGFSMGLGPVPFIVLGEIFSQEAKKIIAPFAQTMNFLMTFTVGLLYPALSDSVGTGSTFLIFAGFCFFGLIFSIFVIPETKGKSLVEIQLLLQKK